jgi:predicted metal-dependent hydrolase
MTYLQAYPEQLQEQARALIDGGGLDTHLQRKYPDLHEVRTDRALYDYVVGLKNQYLRGADPLSKVLFDNKLQTVAQALGTHTAVSRVQGNKLKAKREIRIAALFRHLPAAFLRMITVHELAHLKEKSHDKAFYQLCVYMEPDYHQIEFDLRMVLSHLDRIGPLATMAAKNPGNASP